MKDTISVLIVDDNVEFGNLLNDYMNREVDIEVAGIARDGVQAMEMISSLKPNVVVLDIIMPNLDGIGVLERVSAGQTGQKPLFIVLSAIGQDVFIQKAVSLGAEYYIVKPFDVDVLVSRIRQIYGEKHVTQFSSKKPFTRLSYRNSGKLESAKNSLEVEITNLMHEVGIPPHMSGYQYIREAIIKTVNDSKIFSSITKSLYPAVAEKYNTTPQKVERAIRNAIESAWTRGNPDSVDALFGYTTGYGKGKPTNSEFIAMMADKVKLILNVNS